MGGPSSAPAKAKVGVERGEQRDFGGRKGGLKTGEGRSQTGSPKLGWGAQNWERNPKLGGEPATERGQKSGEGDWGTPKPGRGTPNPAGGAAAEPPHPKPPQDPKFLLLRPPKNAQTPLRAVSPLLQGLVQNMGGVWDLGGLQSRDLGGAAPPEPPPGFWGGGVTPWPPPGPPGPPSAAAASVSSSPARLGRSTSGTPQKRAGVGGNMGGTPGPGKEGPQNEGGVRRDVGVQGKPQNWARPRNWGGGGGGLEG